MSIYVATISSRNQLGQLMESMHLTGRAVEVGTHLGHFARALLLGWPGHLTCVDPYELAPDGYAEQVPLLEGTNRGDRVKDRQEAEHRLRPFVRQRRCTLLQETSERAAPGFEDGSLDLVYLDGDHRTHEVTRDLELWWPKVRPGGLLAGHDIICPGEGPDGRWGAAIQPAVLGFFRNNAGPHADDPGPYYQMTHPLYLVPEEGGLPWSFYVVKPG